MPVKKRYEPWSCHSEKAFKSHANRKHCQKHRLTNDCFSARVPLKRCILDIASAEGASEENLGFLEPWKSKIAPETVRFCLKTRKAAYPRKKRDFWFPPPEVARLGGGDFAFPPPPQNDQVLGGEENLVLAVAWPRRQLGFVWRCWAFSSHKIHSDFFALFGGAEHLVLIKCIRISSLLHSYGSCETRKQNGTLIFLYFIAWSGSGINANVWMTTAVALLMRSHQCTFISHYLFVLHAGMIYAIKERVNVLRHMSFVLVERTTCHEKHATRYVT